MQQFGTYDDNNAAIVNQNVLFKDLCNDSLLIIMYNQGLSFSAHGLSPS